MPKLVDHMKGEMRSFTQIYNLMSLSIPVMVIVDLLYDVWMWLKAAKTDVCSWVLWEVINSKSAFSCAVELKGLNWATVCFDREENMEEFYKYYKNRHLAILWPNKDQSNIAYKSIFHMQCYLCFKTMCNSTKSGLKLQVVSKGGNHYVSYETPSVVLTKLSYHRR